MADTIPGLLRGFPVTVEIPVRWGDMDAFGHVNNAVYLRYFESARIAYLERLGDPAFLNNTAVGPILAATSVRFKFPVSYPDTLSVGARSSDIAEDRFTQEYLVVSQRHCRVAASGDGLVVTYDYRSQRRAPIPPALRRNTRRLEATAPLA